MLVSKVKQLSEGVKEIKDFCMTKFAPSILEDADDESIVMLPKILKLLNVSMDVINEQACVIESINEKLDRLLETKETKEES